jgi:hypothetical protein
MTVGRPGLDGRNGHVEIPVDIPIDIQIDICTDIVVDVVRVLPVVIRSKADTAYVSLLPVSSLNLVPIAHRPRATVP